MLSEISWCLDNLIISVNTADDNLISFCFEASKSKKFAKPTRFCYLISEIRVGLILIIFNGGRPYGSLFWRILKWFLARVIQVKNRDLRNALKVRQYRLSVHKQQKIPLEPYRKMSHSVRKIKKHENNDVSIMKNRDYSKTRLAPT